MACTRGKSPLKDQVIMWEDQVRVGLPLCHSVPEGVQKRDIRQVIPILNLFPNIS